MATEVVAVVGAGTMGVGVAEALAGAGHPVILLDVADAPLARARDQIARNVRFRALFRRDASEPADTVLARIQFTTDYGALAGADFVIENVTERWAVKQQVWPRMDAICPPQCIFAADTSAIPIARLAALTRRPDRVVGAHFMNPVALKPTVEVIRAPATTDATLDALKQLLASMGKDCIVVNDAPGFVSNRVLMLTVNEAIFVLQDGVATAGDIDAIFKQCFGHRMGPLETADLIGLDTILLSLQVLQEHFHDDKFRPCPLLERMVSEGLHGQKSGRGFYTYAGDALPA